MTNEEIARKLNEIVSRYKDDDDVEMDTDLFLSEVDGLRARLNWYLSKDERQF